MFEPIAVVGRGCVLPGALSPDALWQAVAAGQEAITSAPPGHWGLDAARVLASGAGAPSETSCTDRGGYVQGFEQVFEPEAFALESERLRALDPLFQWLLHSAREALRDAGIERLDGLRADVLVGNLSYPTPSFARFAESVWLDRDTTPGISPDNRFMSGYPAHLVARTLGAGGIAFSLDAACASSLYAIKLACDRLHDHDADLVLAGAVNHADDLFLHMGFTALQALSPSGRSRPFHREADGLLPAEGAAFVALKRLADAEAAGDRIHGVIRAIGLSNDGRKGGFLAPDTGGQVRAMRAAYESSGIDPSSVSLLECHATGTAVGDAIELRSMKAVFEGTDELPIGSLKSNLGHLITASGMAGLIKVMAAFAHGQRPPTLHVDDPTPELLASPFRVLTKAEDWPSDGPRRAAINNFGFGGNNAHLIVEEWRPNGSQVSVQRPPAAPIAICGMGVVAGPCHGVAAFRERLLGAESGAPTRTDRATVPLAGLRFPPSELRLALAQQTLMLEVALAATAESAPATAERSAVIVGMGCDAEACRSGLRWRLHSVLAPADRAPGPHEGWLETARDAVVGSLGASGVLGTMPNIPANRLNVQLDWRAFGFTVSGEELSGLDALRIAARALRRGEIDAALVGAVDLACEPVHQAAAAAMLPADRQRPGDAAVALVLKRLDDARAQGDAIYALLPGDDGDPAGALELSLSDRESVVTEKFGHAHAASGLLHVAAAAIACASGARPAHGPAAPWLCAERAARVVVRSFSGQTDAFTLTAAHAPVATDAAAPILKLFGGEDRAGVARHLREGVEDATGPARLALLATDPEQLATRAEQALALLESSAPHIAADGIHYRDRPIEGELALVFTGAAAAYRGMGRDLLLALPELGAALARRHPVLGAVAEQVYETDPAAPMLPRDQLEGCVLLCQAHALLARSILGLRPQAALGLSSGETNALFAFGAWRDLDVMFEEIAQSGMYGRDLTGECRAAAQAWGLPAGSKVAWRNWRLLAPVEAVEAALEGEPRASITIINAPDDCVIGGDAEACSRVLARVGRARAIDLGHDMVVHCAELGPYAETWRRIHDRETHPVEGVRFYSNATGTHYRPDRSSATQALLGQALQPVDFRRTVQAAWRDGVRVFVELGPRNTLTGAIGKTLADREHLALAFDQQSQSAPAHLLDLAARLAVAGVEVDLETLRTRLPVRAGAGAQDRTLHLDAHMPRIVLPPRPARPASDGVDMDEVQVMQPAPALPPATAPRPRYAGVPARPVAALPASGAREVPPATVPRQDPSADTPMTRVLAQTTALHHAFISDQTRLHRQFLSLHDARLQALSPVRAVLPDHAGPPPAPALTQALAHPEPAVELEEKALRAYSRADLEILASGKISQIFGPQFKEQDGYHRQVRMPEPPLLLVDRVTGIEGEPGSMGLGTIWTETDISPDAWYLHHGRVPPGILIESGQADLLLISWLGVDGLNKGERIYRLLGCELTFHEGGMPGPGDTLRYDIHVDGHAKTGDVRLFFFHYDCRVGDRVVLSVRNGQAGFFSDDELAGSGGVLWSAATDEPKADARLDPPPGCTRRRSFTCEQVDAWVAGDAYACFGDGFELAAPHQRTPSLPSGRMHLIGSVPAFDPAGGPWHRGYLRAEAAVTPDHWFYGGHFKNDPCMPGTLMADAAVQALAFHMAALGFTVARDGWRFEAVPDERYKFICRGQVVPDRPHLLSYEIFVEEVIDGDRPTVYAALLCSSDGFKVFQCRRFGLRLVPDWPLGDRRELLAEVGPLRPLRADSDVRGDYAAMLACAWGAPSEAFGKMYARFDRGRRVPRLPGPPYHCMSRVLAIDGPPGKATIGVTVEAEFDVLPDAWYFTENGCQVMPFSVLMEVLLQPCGWLASYLGFAVTDTGDLAFRNLDGDDAVPTMEVTPQSGTLRTRASLVRFSRVGQMTLVFFRVECSCGDWPVLAMNTSFGFFDAAALAHQVGLPTSDQARAQRDTPCEVALELAERPAELYSGSARIAGGRLRMIDAITGYWPEGGAAGLGRIRGLQRIDPGAWYFKAHFFQDPVQPGSLGVDALLQLLQAWMLLQGLDQGLERPRFEAIALDQPLVWRYRGQVVPTNREVITELEITRVEREPNAVLAVAGGNLWVDGLRIYEVENLAMRLVAEPDERGTRDIVLDPTKQPWLRDHCPTHTTPALPIACVVDYLAQAARALAPDLVVIALEDVGVFRWITIDQRGVRLRVETRQIEQDLVEASLLLVEPASDARPVASGKVRLADRYPPPPPAEPPLTTGELDDRPYDHGALFHGPAFQTMRTLRRDRTGASLELDAAPAGAPDGLVNPALLDGVLQGLPHDRLDLWFDEIGADRLCYPQWIERITFHGPSPSRGTMRGEVRPAGIERRRRQPRFRSQIIAHGEVWAAIEHSEVLVSKGRLADVPHRDLRTFFRDRRYVAGLSLSRLIDGASELADAEVALVDWLPGTLEAAYQVDGERAAITTAIAAKEHVARKVEAHPGTVRLADGEASCASAPLTSFPLRIEHRERTTRVADGGPERLELGPVLAFWRGRMGIAEWPGEQLYMATVRRFLRRATLADPSSLEQIRGRPVMFLGNHQVGIESLLFALVASALNQRPVVTIAKQEHRGTWLGRLLDVCQSYPGVVSDRALMFFDRDDKASMLQLMREVENALAAEGLSLMVHAEGTRSLQCRQPVTQLSGVLLDLAITARLPIVPVRFAGALPVEPAATRLEFPLGCARQDIYLGAPLPAEELAALPLADRKRRVLEAMNTLGPDLMQETPNPPDAAFEAGVAGLMQALAMAAPQATILHALQLDPACQGPLRALVEALLAGAPLAGEELEAAWLRRLGAWFTDG